MKEEGVMLGMKFFPDDVQIGSLKGFDEGFREQLNPPMGLPMCCGGLDHDAEGHPNLLFR